MRRVVEPTRPTAGLRPRQEASTSWFNQIELDGLAGPALDDEGLRANATAANALAACVPESSVPPNGAVS